MRWTFSSHPRTVLFGLLLLVAATGDTLALNLNITTQQGKSYRNAHLDQVTTGGLAISFSGGSTFIDWRDLSADWQEYFRYDGRLGRQNPALAGKQAYLAWTAKEAYYDRKPPAVSAPSPSPPPSLPPEPQHRPAESPPSSPLPQKLEDHLPENWRVIGLGVSLAMMAVGAIWGFVGARRKQEGLIVPSPLEVDREAAKAHAESSVFDETSPVRGDIYYARVLGLSGRITRDALRLRYRELTAYFRPERIQEMTPAAREQARGRLRLINEAYEFFRRRLRMKQ